MQQLPGLKSIHKQSAKNTLPLPRVADAAAIGSQAVPILQEYHVCEIASAVHERDMYSIISELMLLDQHACCAVHENHITELQEGGICCLSSQYQPDYWHRQYRKKYFCTCSCSDTAEQHNKLYEM